MQKRLAYMGGANQEDRMIADKLRSLKNAIKSSYQAETVALPEGEFKCLINPNRLSMESDDKLLSIPFKEVPIGANDEVTIDLGVGSIVEWKETSTHWILYQRYLEENAYYRFAMRMCDQQVELEDGSKFWAYIKGNDSKTINWQKTRGFIFNELNYTLEIYVSNTEITKQLLQRFKKLKVYDRMWEVQAKDDITTEGLIVAYLKEDYNNQWAQTQTEEDLSKPEDAIDPSVAPIQGPDKVYPYDIVTFTTSLTDGSWSINNNKVRIVKQDSTSTLIEVVTGKSGSFSISYTTNGNRYEKEVTILSL